MEKNEITDRIARQNLQRYLRQLAYFEPEIPLAPIDGTAGEDTTAAIREFQRLNGLNITGVADKETWDRIYGEYLLSLERALPPIPFSPFPLTPMDYSAKMGDRGFLVQAIQHILAEISLIYKIFPEIEESGVFDEATENAVKTLQRGYSLEETGAVDRRTWNALVRQYEKRGLYSME
jgi:peptidoglycan hydrolase-like protein with peptidoglycan-binding domain